ncbi:TetR/AcrR family transcriptional regulator [Nocardioides zeae]
MTTRGEDMRARVLRAALEELAATGVVGISLRAIARRVGMTHQAISHYFTSRSALFTQLAIEGYAELRAEMREALATLPETDPAGPAVDPTGRAVDRVAAVGAAYLRFADERPTLFDLLYGGGASLTDGERSSTPPGRPSGRSSCPSSPTPAPTAGEATWRSRTSASPPGPCCSA